jgi:hypothetical protein
MTLFGCARNCLRTRTLLCVWLSHLGSLISLSTPITKSKAKEICLRNMSWRPIDLRDVKDRTLLGNRLTDGGKVFSLTHRPCSTPQKHFSASSIHFCYRLSKLQGLVRLEGLGKSGKKANHIIGSRIHNLPAFSIVPQPLRCCVPHYPHKHTHTHTHTHTQIINEVQG